MTTNAVLLAPAVGDLKRAGLGRLTISLDTLQRERFVKLARFDELPRVLAGIDSAVDDFPGFKIDTVVIRGVNDDEIISLLEFAKARRAELRFIEYMDVGGATNWSMAQVVSRDELLKTIGAHYGPVEPLREKSSAPADRYRLSDGTIFGIVASTTEPFCRSCDRSRLTADGVWYLCLYAARGVDLRGPLRGGVSDEALRDLITSVWHARTDRGAENRLDVRVRSPLIPLKALRRDPHSGDAYARRLNQSAVESRQLRAFSRQFAVQSAVFSSVGSRQVRASVTLLAFGEAYLHLGDDRREDGAELVSLVFEAELGYAWRVGERRSTDLCQTGFRLLRLSQRGPHLVERVGVGRPVVRFDQVVEAPSAARISCPQTTSLG